MFKFMIRIIVLFCWGISLFLRASEIKSIINYTVNTQKGIIHMT